MRKIPLTFSPLNTDQDIYITFDVNMLNVCNYSCNYCCEYCVKNNNINAIYIDCVALIKFLNIFRTTVSKKLKISLYGGEPTIHPEFLYLYTTLLKMDSNIYLEAFSNFSNKIELYNTYLSTNSKLILTFHRAQWNTIDSFINKIKLLNTKYLNNIIINIMYEHDTTDDSIFVLKTLKEYYVLNNSNERNVILKIIRLTDTFKLNYTKEQLDKFMALNKEVDNVPQYQITYLDKTCSFETNESLECCTSNFLYWYCNAGIVEYYINFTGKIYSCLSTCYLEKAYNKDMSIATIFNLSKLLKQKLTLCKTTCCTNYDTTKFNALKRNTLFNFKNNF